MLANQDQTSRKLKLVEGLSPQRVSLIATKSIEPYTYNQFDHDSSDSDCTV